MTENEAIKLIKNFPTWNMDDQWIENDEMEELTNFCVKTLEEIQQYREIGTVAECLAAVEKQKAKEPYVWGDGKG